MELRHFLSTALRKFLSVMHARACVGVYWVRIKDKNEFLTTAKFIPPGLPVHFSKHNSIDDYVPNPYFLIFPSFPNYVFMTWRIGYFHVSFLERKTPSLLPALLLGFPYLG